MLDSSGRRSCSGCMPFDAYFLIIVVVDPVELVVRPEVLILRVTCAGFDCFDSSFRKNFFFGVDGFSS